MSADRIKVKFNKKGRDADDGLQFGDADEDVPHTNNPVTAEDLINNSRTRRLSIDSTSVASLDDDHDVSMEARRKLLIACALIFFFMTAEIIGGIISGSLAIMTDALHLLTDLVGFGISIAALSLSKRPATRKLTFGWYRAEILGALISVVLVWAITAILVMLAIQRIAANDFEIEAQVMLITSSLGVAINLFMGVQLQHGHGHGHGHSHSVGGGAPKQRLSDAERERTFHGHSHNYGATGGQQPADGRNQSTHLPNGISMPADAPVAKAAENLNLRAAIMNMLGDLCQSVGVMIASLIVFFQPEYKIADPICTFLFSALVLFTTINIIKDVFYILMEGTPGNIDYEHMKTDLLKIPGVQSVHHVRIWALTASKVAMAAHIDYSGDNYGGVLKQCRKVLRRKYGITDLTLQIEVEPDYQISTD